MPDPGDDTYNLSVEFNGVASSLSNYMWANLATIDDPSRGALWTQIQTLQAYAMHMIALSMAATVSAVANPIQQIKTATSQANHALQVLKDIDKAAKIAAAAVGLAAAVMSDDPGTVASSLQDLLTASTS